jgi:hypothetical protein
MKNGCNYAWCLYRKNNEGPITNDIETERPEVNESEWLRMVAEVIESVLNATAALAL